MNITAITPEELSNNLGFILSMVNRGHMFKIIQEGESSILVTSIKNPTIPDLDPLPLTAPPPPGIDLVPETEIRNYVHESLAEMQKEM
jgi:hypothetical protein